MSRVTVAAVRPGSFIVEYVVSVTRSEFADLVTRKPPSGTRDASVRVTPSCVSAISLGFAMPSTALACAR